MWVVAIILTLLILVILVVMSVKSDPRVELLKKRYREFVDTLPPKYDSLKKKSIITGSYAKGLIGENVNKGGDILVCFEGEDQNDFFHVLLHELAHTSVSEYDHSSSFWDNFKELSELAERGGFYKSGVNKPYCGGVINDSVQTAV